MRVQSGADSLTWLCDVCARPVAAGAGYVGLDHAEQDERERETAAWKARNEDKPGGVGLDDLMELQEPTRWTPLHHACDPKPDASAYTIEVERIDTPRKMLAWTAHMMGKAWLEHTD